MRNYCDVAMISNFDIVNMCYSFGYTTEEHIMINRVRGVNDILDTHFLSFVINKMKSHLEYHNFNEIFTPIIEHTDLFIHAMGETTDVVSKEMFLIAQKNTDSKKSICLRPEGTASAIRACYENRVQRFPWKVFTYGPMFRYERPQKGRLRQFHQMSVEVIGSSSVGEDAYFISMLDMLFSREYKLENYVLKLNFLGCSDDRKRHKQQLKVFLDEQQDLICTTCLERKKKNPLRVFDCKDEKCKKQYENAPRCTDFLCQDCEVEWQKLKEFLSLASTNFIVDTFLVRGLDYYSKTVFEFFSRDLGAQNSFCGGGRYNLGREVGAKKDYECVGVGIGIERLLMLLENKRDILMIPQKPPLHVILPLSEKQDALAILLASELQAKKYAVDIIFEKASMTNMMKKANKMKAKFVLIFGDDEQQKGTVSVKNMLSGKSKEIKQVDIVSFLS
jgi:histidyl-tRNA synthetase